MLDANSALVSELTVHLVLALWMPTAASPDKVFGAYHKLILHPFVDRGKGFFRNIKPGRRRGFGVQHRRLFFDPSRR